MGDFENRLRKNAKHFKAWARREGVTAYRVYDLDIPEWPFAIDWYAGLVHVMEYPRRKALRDGSLVEARAEVVRTIEAVLEVPADRVFTKTHERLPWGKAQHGPKAQAGVVVTVEEYGRRFECNLSDYLDTGLFLDHRVTRVRVGREAQGKRFLNLFAYTGAFTVHAACGGAASTTSVDLSPTYCDWAQRNLALNGLAPSRQHQVVRADVLQWLETAQGPYDLIVCDPPSFSTSKKMEKSFDVQKAHGRLVGRLQQLLAPGGTLYFSTNYLGFQLSEALAPLEELTPRSLPQDFRRTVHRCWRFGPGAPTR